MAELLVIAGQREGELRPSSLEAIAAARGVKQAGDMLAVVLIAADPKAFVGALSVEGVDEVIAVKATDDFQPDLTEAVITALVAARAVAWPPTCRRCGAKRAPWSPPAPATPRRCWSTSTSPARRRCS